MTEIALQGQDKDVVKIAGASLVITFADCILQAAQKQKEKTLSRSERER